MVWAEPKTKAEEVADEVYEWIMKFTDEPKGNLEKMCVGGFAGPNTLSKSENPTEKQIGRFIDRLCLYQSGGLKWEDRLEEEE